jgi:hypothetical protein
MSAGQKVFGSTSLCQKTFWPTDIWLTQYEKRFFDQSTVDEKKSLFVGQSVCQK